MDKQFLDSKTESSGCTLEEYKYIYPRLLNEFFQLYIDFNEFVFIEREILNHSILFESCEKGMVKISDFDYRRENFDPFEINCGQEKFLEMMSYYEKRKASHKAIINYLETKKLKMELPKSISQAEKDQIFNEMVFNKGLFYYSDIHKDKIKNSYKNLENNFETKEDFVKAVNSLLHANGLHFYSKLRTFDKEIDFIGFIEKQYNLYNEYTLNNSLNWLNFTKKAVMYGFGILSIESDSLKASFMGWYNETKAKIQPQQNNEKEPDFSKGILFEPSFSEIAFEYNTGRNYQNKQDLIAVNWNSYIYFQQKFEPFYERHRVIPVDYFNDLIFKFRQHFPKDESRIVGVNYFDDLIEQLINKYSNQTNPPQQTETIKTDEVKKELHPDFNPNYWNKDCFELFKYCYDNYFKGTKRELTNIWFYLNEYDRNNDKRKYVLKATKDKYREFIKINYKIDLKNFDKAEQKYQTKVYPALNEHRQIFEDSIK